MDANDVRVMLMRELRTMKQGALAARLGIARTSLNRVLAGKREPGQDICAALGLRRRIIYERIGSLHYEGKEQKEEARGAGI